MKFEILDNAVLLDIDNKKKTVKLESFIKTFSDLKTGIETPFLPQECIKYKEKGNNIILILYLPTSKFKANYKDEVFENCIRPNVISKFSLTKDQDNYIINSILIFGVKENQRILINPNTELYGIPFPNISTNGSVCWGGNSIAGKFISLLGLKTYVDRYFSLPFNGDLWSSTFMKNLSIESIRDMFLKLQEFETYPDSWLENTGRQKVKMLYE